MLNYFLIIFPNDRVQISISLIRKSWISSSISKMFKGFWFRQPGIPEMFHFENVFLVSPFLFVFLQICKSETSSKNRGWYSFTTFNLSTLRSNLWWCFPWQSCRTAVHLELFFLNEVWETLFFHLKLGRKDGKKVNSTILYVSGSLWSLEEHLLNFTSSFWKWIVNYSGTISGQKLFDIWPLRNLWGTNIKHFLLVAFLQRINTLSSHNLLLSFFIVGLLRHLSLCWDEVFWVFIIFWFQSKTDG